MEDYKRILKETKEFMDSELKRDLDILLSDIPSAPIISPNKFVIMLEDYEERFEKRAHDVFLNVGKRFGLEASNKKLNFELTKHLNDWETFASKEIFWELKNNISFDVSNIIDDENSLL